MLKESSLPNYERPPLVETVFSAQFDPLNATSLHIAQFWSLIRSSFDKIAPQPPLPSIIEPEVLPTSSQPISIFLNSDQNDARVFVSSSDETRLIQIQRDRFLFNWRSQPHNTNYPRFEKNYQEFLGLLEKFSQFCINENLGSLIFNQFELTYVNLIFEDKTGVIAPEKQLFPDHEFRASVDRFLPFPEISNWSSSFKLPEKNGRLHISMQRAFTPDEQARLVPVIRVDLTARGMPVHKTTTYMDDWFSLAHEWVVKGFADIVSVDVQKASWGRKP
jgi:uncharacterized protein (TIGR04255 family)